MRGYGDIFIIQSQKSKDSDHPAFGIVETRKLASSRGECRDIAAELPLQKASRVRPGDPETAIFRQSGDASLVVYGQAGELLQPFRSLLRTIVRADPPWRHIRSGVEREGLAKLQRWTSLAKSRVRRPVPLTTATSPQSRNRASVLVKSGAAMARIRPDTATGRKTVAASISKVAPLMKMHTARMASPVPAL